MTQITFLCYLCQPQNLNIRYVIQQMEMAFLSPMIVEGIVQGRQRVDLSFEALKRIGDLPLSWADQHRLLDAA